MNRSSKLRKLQIAISLFTIFICAGLVSGSTVFDTDIEILQSDASGVTLRYLVPEASTTPYEDYGFYLLEVPRTAQTAKEGTVGIPVKIVPLALPPGATARVTVQSSEYESLPFKTIAPYFSRSSSDALRQAYQQAKNSIPIIPDTQPYIASVGVTRGLTIARLAIPTARYSLEPQELSALKSMTVRVDFTGGNIRPALGYQDPGPVYGRMFREIVANYDIGYAWAAARQMPFAKTAAVSQTPFDSSSTWIRIELTADGIYGFGWSQFSMAGVNPLDIDPSQIRIFYGGGRELPVPNSEPRPQLREIPIKIIGGEDGRFDNGDLVVFYADAVDSRDYSSQFHRFLWYKDHYTEKNVYWLTTSGSFQGPPKRIQTANITSGGPVDVSVDSYKAVFHKEQEAEFRGGGSDDEFEWYWGRGQSFSAPIQIYDHIPGSDATIIIVHEDGWPDLSINNAPAINGTNYQTYTTFHSSSLVDGANTLQMHSVNDMAFNYVDVEYQRWLKVIDGTLTFEQPDTFGMIQYNLTQVVSPFFLFDIGDRNNPVELTGTLNGANLTFNDTVSSGSHKRYCITSRNRLKSPGAVAVYQMDNLRDVARAQNRADEIIITYDGFYDQAMRLAAHRQQAYGLTVRVVKLTDIYNQFSYGLPDAVAIRDFLKYTFENWSDPAPSFACLLGDGNYDYRNYRGFNIRNYVPPFENIKYSGTMGDENFIYFGADGYIDSDNNLLPDMVIGRISARSAQEADDIIGKIEDYDSHPDLGPWRNRVLLVSDDNLHPGTAGETYHTENAESLALRHVPNKFETNKIYMVEYLMGPGGEKVEARDALVSAWNQGALIINWIGHGSANLWADEHVFRRIEDIPRLTNGKRLPLVFTASCSIGRFDVPGVECMAEELLRGRSRGAISVVSATRDSWAVPNSFLNNGFFDQVLYHDSISVGMALYMAKFLNNHLIDQNDRYYMVFGDPAQILQFPKYDIRITSAPDTLMALSVDSLAGDLTDNNGNVRTDFNGTVWITVKDGSVLRQVTLRDNLNNPLTSQISFVAPGATIFFGPADVTAGHFTSRFFIPKDISYGSRGARIYTYAGNDSYDAVGVRDSLFISGSVSSIQDSIGPTIQLLADGRPFGEGVTMVPSNFTLGAEVRDEHGVNITGQLGHGIVVSVDDGRVYEGDVTSYFRYNDGDYQSGRLDVKLPSIPLGEHDISVKVWDNFNNSTLITQRVEAVSTDQLELTDVMNYPNPIRKGVDGTAFQYCLTDNVDRVTIKIFTEAGKKIKTLDITSSDLTRMDCNQVSWNLLDADGDRLANGIYLYKVTAEKRRGDGSSEHADKTGKLVILR